MGNACFCSLATWMSKMRSRYHPHRNRPGQLSLTWVRPRNLPNTFFLRVNNAVMDTPAVSWPCSRSQDTWAKCHSVCTVHRACSHAHMFSFCLIHSSPSMSVPLRLSTGVGKHQLFNASFT